MERSRYASCAPAGTSTSHRRRLLRSRRRAAPHAARRRGLQRRAGGPPSESYLKIPAILEAAQAVGSRGGPSRLRLPRRERRLRPGGDRRRPDLGRPGPRDHRRDGRQDRSPPGRRRCRGRDRARARPSRSRPSRRSRRSSTSTGFRSRSRRRPEVAARASGSFKPTKRSRTRSRGPHARPRRTSRPTTSISSATSSGRATSRSRCSATASGAILSFPERDCSLQRRHQKLVEESPSPALDPSVREAIMEAAAQVSASRSATATRERASSSSTADGKTFYFLEMNTRLQVEHPVTELVTGVDLVKAQLLVAAGEAARASGRTTSSCGVTRSNAASTPRTRRRTSCRPRDTSATTRSRPGPACASTRGPKRTGRSRRRTTH